MNRLKSLDPQFLQVYPYIFVVRVLEYYVYTCSAFNPLTYACGPYFCATVRSTPEWCSHTVTHRHTT